MFAFAIAQCKGALTANTQYAAMFAEVRDSIRKYWIPKKKKKWEVHLTFWETMQIHYGGFRMFRGCTALKVWYLNYKQNTVFPLLKVLPLI